MCERPPATSVEEIQFESVFRYGSLLKAIGSALNPGRIGIGMVVLALLVGGGQMWDAATVSDQADNLLVPFGSTVQWVDKAIGEIVTATVELDAAQFTSSTRDLLWGTPLRLWGSGHQWFVILFGLWTAAVLAFGGGLLCRMEAVSIATNDAPRLNPALAMVIPRWPAFFGALITPLALAGLLSIILIVFGFVLFNIPAIDIIGGLLYGIALLFGLGIAMLVLGFIVSGLLLLPVVATENCDGADAMHRAIAYVVAKPLTWMLYLFTIILGLALGLLLVRGVGNFTVALTSELAGVWTPADMMQQVVAIAQGGEAPDLSWHVRWTVGLVAFWTSLVNWAIGGWMVAYLMAASTRAYLLLRRSCDAQDEREIWWPGLIRGTLAPEPPQVGDDS
ncbi:MAG: hypothetical protein GY894_02325 [Planctomycetes bacterium]|nr:hypothetical protein [Planctomycetota bacterium]MCP4838186.1 hypothetical protein [Planctomycetota bacterium]